MALVINDRVKESTTTTGTGTVTLGGAVQGFETFAAGIGNSNTTYYCIQLNAEFEVGLGTLAGDSSTLARTTVISSSNSDNAVNFSSGTKFVFCCLPASKTTILDASNNLTLPGKLSMPDVTSGKILVADGTSYEEVAVSGDVTIASSGAITIANNAVETAMINADAVTGAKIADNAINSEHYTDGSIDTAHIADSQITNAKMADNAIDTAEIAASAVETAKINDAAVTTAKIADDAVGADQLAANAVVNASVASNAAIVDTKLATISTANKVDIGALDIDGASDIGADLVDADLIIVDDGANGTEKKSAMSRVKTYIADVTLTTAAQTNITSLGTLTGLNVNGTSNLDAVDIDGAVQLDAAFTVGANDQGYDVTLHGDTASRNVVWDSSEDSLIFSDNAKARFGGGSDLQIFHDGSDSYVKDAGTGRLVVETNGTDVSLKAGAENMLVAAKDGAVTLYYDNASKLATAADGIAVTGVITASGIVTANAKLDLNGTELILDADADTSITADTDDKIDYRIGGADVMQMNATAFSGGAIYENADDIAANYSITAGKNAMSVGPITIASGVTVTVPSGQRWVIL